jgi:hypothetical protein
VEGIGKEEEEEIGGSGFVGISKKVKMKITEPASLTVVAIAEIIIGLIGSALLAMFLLIAVESHQGGVGPGLGGIFILSFLSFLFPTPLIFISGILMLGFRKIARKTERILSEIVRIYYIVAALFNLFSFNIIGLLFCIICLGMAIKKLRFLKNL